MVFNFKILSEREGFEPPLAFTKSVFKTGAINRSATFPALENMSKDWVELDLNQ